MHSRYSLLVLLAALLTFALAGPRPLAIPLNKKPQPERLAAAVTTEGKNVPVGGSDETTNYLVTLSRVVTNLEKDSLFDYLMAKGAVVKQVYDYRVYKGVLFSIPTVSDLGLTTWESSLTKMDGVKSVEEDSVIKTN
ncbi:proteinase inhibitor domain containing protein [Pseudohyphozyma bogoriensis]|nr:proteinase inhibitor domain containing protein [Pseudohyphozyma bogoriensis]